MTPDEVWPEIIKAFAFYGKKVRPMKGERRKMIQRLLDDDYDTDELVAAVHGYVHQHDGLDAPEGEWQPRKYFTPESVFRLDKLEMRIEQGDTPWVRVNAKERHEQEVKARQEAARKRVEAARKERSTTPLRAVEGF